MSREREGERARPLQPAVSPLSIAEPGQQQRRQQEGGGEGVGGEEVGGAGGGRPGHIRACLRPSHVTGCQRRSPGCRVLAPGKGCSPRGERAEFCSPPSILREAPHPALLCPGTPPWRSFLRSFICLLEQEIAARSAPFAGVLKPF